jgi:hypothetical protein
MDAMSLTNEIFPTRESALAKHRDRIICLRIPPPPKCKVYKPCCDMEMDYVIEYIQIPKYLEINFELTLITDDMGNFVWRYIRI